MVKLSQKPFNPAYEAVRKVYTSQTQWKPQSTPAVASIRPRLNQKVKNLFHWEPTNRVQVDTLLTWTDIDTTIKFFPMSKGKATRNGELARTLVSHLHNVDKLLELLQNSGNPASIKSLWKLIFKGRRNEITTGILPGRDDVLKKRCPVLNQPSYVSLPYSLSEVITHDSC